MKTTVIQVFGTNFVVPSVYFDLKPIGMGAFGLVCEAKMGESLVAVKKVGNPFRNLTLAKRYF